MKVMILGANGMLGHKLYQTLSVSFDVFGTIRGIFNDIAHYGFFLNNTIIPQFNALDNNNLKSLIIRLRPEVVINCIGIIKQLREANDRLLSLEINALLPHRLYQICCPLGIRLINFSTDCVFSGKKGNYREGDPSDAEDIYGKTKYLGEVFGENAITFRTSIIGRELSSSNGLVEWFISNRGRKVNGYTNAIYTGFPTLHLSQIIRDLIINNPKLNGLYNLSSDPISKFELLSMINERMNLNIDINGFSDFNCDRSLDSSTFKNLTGLKPLPWKKMIDEFAVDAQDYKKWRE